MSALGHESTALPPIPDLSADSSLAPLDRPHIGAEAQGYELPMPPTCLGRSGCMPTTLSQIASRDMLFPREGVQDRLTQ